MKYPLPSTAYSFNATAKTITFVGTVPAEISNILHVANITRGVIYFQPQAGIALSGSYSSPVLTIVTDTTGHANGDKLLIIYDDAIPGATASKQDTGNSSLASIDSKTPALSGGAVPVAPNVQQGGGAITASTTRVTLATDGPGVANLASIAGLSIPAHDFIALSYTGSNLTGVVYKTGGSGGTTVGTLTLAYSGSNLTSVTKS